MWHIIFCRIFPNEFNFWSHNCNSLTSSITRLSFSKGDDTISWNFSSVLGTPTPIESPHIILDHRQHRMDALSLRRRDWLRRERVALAWRVCSTLVLLCLRETVEGHIGGLNCVQPENYRLDFSSPSPVPIRHGYETTPKLVRNAKHSFKVPDDCVCGQLLANLHQPPCR